MAKFETPGGSPSDAVAGGAVPGDLLERFEETEAALHAAVTRLRSEGTNVRAAVDTYRRSIRLAEQVFEEVYPLLANALAAAAAGSEAEKQESKGLVRGLLDDISGAVATLMAPVSALRGFADSGGGGAPP